MLRLALLVAVLVLLLFFMRRAAGRLAPKVAFASLAFLVTRVPVLVVWALGAIGWLALLAPKAIATSIRTPYGTSATFIRMEARILPSRRRRGFLG